MPSGCLAWGQGRKFSEGPLAVKRSEHESGKAPRNREPGILQEFKAFRELLRAGSGHLGVRGGFRHAGGDRQLSGSSVGTPAQRA